MATNLPYRYSVDYTGESADNLVIDEPHSLPNRQVRCFVPTYAPFFKDSVKIYPAGSATPLSPTQYKCLDIVALPTAMAGMDKEIYAIIAITDASVSQDITVEYQALGGAYMQSFETALRLIENLSQDNRPPAWPNIVDMLQYYNPTMHLHAVGDAIGFEYAVVALQQLREAILTGNAANNDQILAYMDSMSQAFATSSNALVTGTGSMLGQHASRTDNPHNVTKADVGLSLVQNFPVATQAEAIAGTAVDRYMTVPLVAQVVANINSVSLGNHPLDTNNPHQTNKTQIGLSLVQNYAMASNSDAIAGTATNLYVSPAAAAAAINARVADVGSSGAAHIARTDNPHNTTAAQVGLGNVQNYATASSAQTLTGTATNLYVTPAGVKAAVDAAATTINASVTAHTGNTSNPHGVTAAQVGLGNVQNYAMATDAQAIAGTANLYLSPSGAKALVQSLNQDLSVKVDTSSVGAANGVAPLDSSALVPAAYLANAPGSNVRDIIFAIADAPSKTATLYGSAVARPLKWAAAFAGSQAYLGTAPNAAVVFNITKNGTVIGTISFASGAQTGTFAGTAGTAVAGDVIRIAFASGADTTMKDLMVSVLLSAN